MKKVILFTMLFAILNIANAQINFGIKSGLNLSNLLNNYQTNTLVGFHGGVWAKIGKGKFALRPELLFSTKGGNVKLENSSDGITLLAIDNDVNLSYLDVPILLEYSPISKLRFHLGTQMSFLLKEKVTRNSIEGVWNVWYPEIQNAYQFKNVDVAAVIGVGIAIKNFDGGVRYNLGLTKASNYLDSSQNVPISDTNFKNAVFQLSIGYRFK